MLFSISKDKSRIAGFVGGSSATDVVVDSKGLFNTTSPVIVDTIISPDDIPLISGRRITRVLPNSSTVTVKSVPRIPIDAVGVRSLMFSFSIVPSEPVMKRAVPCANVIARSDFVGSSSKTTLSITIRVCSVILSLLSSTNLTCIRPSPVRRSSFVITSEPFCGSIDCSSLTISLQPTARSTEPTSLVATCGSTRIRLANAHVCRRLRSSITIYLY